MTPRHVPPYYSIGFKSFQFLFFFVSNSFLNSPTCALVEHDVSASTVVVSISFPLSLLVDGLSAFRKPWLPLSLVSPELHLFEIVWGPASESGLSLYPVVSPCVPSCVLSSSWLVRPPWWYSYSQFFAGLRCIYIPILVKFSGLRGAVADSESAKWIFNWLL